MIIQANALQIPLANESVQCVVTSPPYWGLRDYGIDGQLGLEKTPEEYVGKMVDVFREVRRVLRNDGTIWVNLGDSYANDTKWGGATGGKHVSDLHGNSGVGRQKVTTGLKAKDLVGIPWMVAFALRTDGWYLRSDIIWSKPNPMPESVTDRPTKAHEYVFLLAKRERYFFDQDAVRQAVTGDAHARRSYKTPDGWDTSNGNGGHGSFHRDGREDGFVGYEHKRLDKEGKNSRIHVNRDPNHSPEQTHRRAPGVNPKAVEQGLGIKQNESFAAAVCDLVDSRNIRTVWTIATQPYAEAHFATFPEALVKPCILAGAPVGGIVLDPFSGSGTTVKVAQDLGRVGIGLDLKWDYSLLGKRRAAQQGLRLTEIDQPISNPPPLPGTPAP